MNVALALLSNGLTAVALRRLGRSATLDAGIRDLTLAGPTCRFATIPMRANPIIRLPEENGQSWPPRTAVGDQNI